MNRNKGKEPLGEALGQGQWDQMRKLARPQIEAFRKEREEDGLYRVMWESDVPLFADEVDKYRVLNILCENTKRIGCDVMAFLLTDRRLDVIISGMNDGTETGDGNSAEQLKKMLQEAFEQSFIKYTNISAYRSAAGDLPVVHENAGWAPLDRVELQNVLDEIHGRPVTEGYVKEEADYWWSSSNSYRGRYLWHFLNLWKTLAKLQDR